MSADLHHSSLATLEQRVAELCEWAIGNRVFPGCSVGVVRDDGSKVWAYGRQRYDEDAPVVLPETVYDTASVTKSVVTSSIALKLMEERRLSADDLVSGYLPELRNEYRKVTKIWHLLTYTVVFDLPGGLTNLAKRHPKNLLEELYKTPLMAAPGERYFYTNPPALLLGVILERITGLSLDELAQTYFFGPLGMMTSTMHPETLNARHIAPTEIDGRGEVRGVVHDEAAWNLAQHGQLAGDAGLFSTTPDLLKFCRMLLNQGTFESTKVFEPETVALMYTNQVERLAESTGLGWELNWRLFMGEQASRQTFGKTGFTGCVMLMDPEKKVALVHLSNHTYPHRRENRNEINSFRRNLADIVFGP